MKIGTKFFLVVAVLVLLTGILIAYAAYYSVDQTLNLEAEHNLERARESFQHELAITDQRLRDVVFLTASRPDVIDYAKTNNTTAMQRLAKEILQQSGLGVLTISDKQGTVLARGHSEKLGDSVASQVNVTQALSGQAFSGIEAGTVVDFSLRSSFPIKSGSDILGAVTAGIDFAHNEFLDRLKQKTGADATIFKDDTRIATTIIKEGKRATGTRMDNPKVIETVLRRGEVFSAPNVILGRNYITTYWPIRHAKGHVAGMFFVGMPVSSAGVELIKNRDHRHNLDCRICGNHLLCLCAKC